MKILKRINLSSHFKRNLVSAIMLMGCMAALLFFQLPSKYFEIYFLDIGQGDAVFIKTPENHQVLIDGGPKNTVLERLSEVMPFFDKEIDMLVLSHPHADHMDGLVEVLKRYEVDYVLLAGVQAESSTYLEFLSEIKRQDVEMIIANSERDFRMGETFFDVIYPFHSIEGKAFENLNNSSIALKVSYSDKDILLTGDLEFEAEQELIDSGIDLRAEVFKAGHHGSRTSSTLDFLMKVKPEIVVVQAGRDNKFDHPHPETIRNFHRAGVEKIYRNDLDGTVKFRF